MKILLFDKIHFLASLLDPNVCKLDELGTIYQPSVESLTDSFMGDTNVWSTNELGSMTTDLRSNLLIYELSLYMGGDG